MRLIVKLMLGLLLAAAGVCSFLYYQNNYHAQPVAREKIAHSHERGVVWLLDHRAEILRDRNPMLWWMLGEAARVGGDARLEGLVTEFHASFNRVARRSIWRSLFHPEEFRNATVSAAEYVSLAEYQQYFLYAQTCSQQLAYEPLIQAQHDVNFCWRGMRIIRPACITHQLMAFQIIQRNRCDFEGLEGKIDTLQATIVKQLTYDPRVVDVYLQRVLMLASTGAMKQIKPRWVERVIAAQQKDGGWSGMEPLIPLGSGRYFGFNATAVTVARPTSNFHATAQGVLLSALLLDQTLEGKVQH